MRIGSVAPVVIAGIALACVNRGPTEENLRDALEQANLPDVAVEVDEQEHVVHLSGTVDTMAERIRAEEVAAAVVGTTGRVISDLAVTSIASAVPDEEVTAALDRAIDADPVLQERDIDFDVRQGKVVVSGEVRSVEEKYRVSELVRGTRGVADLSNSLDVSTR